MHSFKYLFYIVICFGINCHFWANSQTKSNINDPTYCISIMHNGALSKPFSNKIQSQNKFIRANHLQKKNKVKKFQAYFASTKSSPVNMRVGPSTDYKIKWVILNKGEPLKVTYAVDNWRKVMDVEGEEGWVHSSVLSRVRWVIVNHSDLTLRKDPRNDSEKVAKVLKGVRCKYLKSVTKGANGLMSKWSYVSCGKLTGWTSKAMWGL